MDFFAHQDAARRASRRLIWIMIIAVVAIVATIDLVAVICFQNFGDGQDQSALIPLLLGTSIVTLLIIAIGGLSAWFGLRGGGRAVAESLGGREILHERADPDERRLLNVVEEMSIASGVPRPPVFMIDDDGINAFAAGFTVNDAAVGVTRGAVHRLSRDELQGVIGHEFSHILNGDMNLNMRLIAVIAGLLALSQIGLYLFRAILGSRSRSSSSRQNKGGGVLPILIFAGAIFLIGLLGWIAGRLIQASFSRKREFLADASAVQFTRNPDGIAGALRRIAGGDSTVSAERAPGMAHLFFANALSNGISSLFATHPPLPERIARIQGVPIPTAKASPTNTNADQPNMAMGFAAAAPQAAQVVSLAGTLSPDRVHLGASLLAHIPAVLAQAAREPVSARATSLLPLLYANPRQAERQLAIVAARDPWLANEARRLQPHWANLDADRARWPLIKLSASALGALSPHQRQEHLALADALATEDGVLNLREFCVLRALRRTLGVASKRSANRSLREASAEIVLVLDALAFCSNNDAHHQDLAFAAGWTRLSMLGHLPSRPSAAACNLTSLGKSLDLLGNLDAAGLRAVTDACAYTVAADGSINPREAELLRLICDELGVPLPPFAES